MIHTKIHTTFTYIPAFETQKWSKVQKIRPIIPIIISIMNNTDTKANKKI